MRRHLLHGVVAMATVALLGLGAMAQDPPAREGPPPARPLARPGGGIPEQRINRLIEDMKLTAEEATKAKQVLETFRQAVDNWQKEHGQELRDAQAKLAAARQSGNQEEMRSARDAVASATAGRRELTDNLRKQLLEVPLTQEQVDRVAAAIQGPPAGPPVPRILALLAQLNLTPEQIDKIRKEVLTEEQRKKLEELEKNPPAGPAAAGGAGPDGGPRRAAARDARGARGGAGNAGRAAQD